MFEVETQGPSGGPGNGPEKREQWRRKTDPREPSGGVTGEHDSRTQVGLPSPRGRQSAPKPNLEPL